MRFLPFVSGLVVVSLVGLLIQWTINFSASSTDMEQSIDIILEWLKAFEHRCDAVVKAQSESITNRTKNAVTGVALFVENRRSNKLIFVISNVLFRLPKNWLVQVACTNENEQWLRSSFVFKEHKERFVVTNIEAQFGGGIGILTLNQLFVTIEFWELIVAEKILVAQIDSGICSGSQASINDFLEYDWIGAPWHGVGLRSKMFAGGNGGFSLRSRSKMLHILRATPYPGSPPASFEDMWFSEILEKMAEESMAVMPNVSVAMSFSVETTFHPKPFAFHASWKHMSEANLAVLIEHCPEILALRPRKNYSA